MTQYLPDSPLVHPALGWGAGALLGLLIMLVVWLIQCRTKNAGLVDTVWAFTAWLPAAGLVLGSLTKTSGLHGLLMVGVMFLWAVRLAWHLHNRYNPKVEDARYAALRNEWGTHANAKMLTFYIMQWVGALLLTLPMVVIGTAPAGAAWLAVLFAGLTTLSILLESVADWQLARFKASGPPKGSICDRGLWAWSRHPNYFFEWSLWVGLALWGLAVGPFPWSLAGLVAPAMMYHFLVNVTGVRPTEEHMSRTRPEAFAEYARRTPAFFPRPPRR